MSKAAGDAPPKQAPKDGCDQRHTVKYWCAAHQKQVPQHDVCYHHHGQHGHRMWNRDVIGALNIGCRFLAVAMSLPQVQVDSMEPQDH